MTRLADIVNGPWAIHPDMHREVLGIYERHMRGPKLDPSEIEARVGKPNGNERPGYRVQDGVAIIEVDGVLAKKMNLFMAISGGTSMQILGNELKKAVADPAAKSILLMIDSPGGTVDGTQELADLVREIRSEKPIHAFVDGLAASAAYWIASAASSITLSSDTAHVGSIGVVAAHTDISRWEEKQGIKTTEIYSGRYKRIHSEYEPLTAEGKDYIQAQLDKLYGIFVTDVASNLGVSVEQVLEDMADGRLFIGQDAVKAGLADGVSDLDSLLARMAAGEYPMRQTIAKSAGVREKAETNKETTMSKTPESLRAEFPDIVQAIESAAELRGATTERERIQAVEKAGLPGHEKLIAELKFDGRTTGPEAAMKCVEAENAKRNQMLGALKAEAPKGLPDAEPPSATTSFEGMTDEQRIKAEWDASEKTRAEFGNDFKLFESARKAELAGKVRTLGKRAA